MVHGRGPVAGPVPSAQAFYTRRVPFEKTNPGRRATMASLHLRMRAVTPPRELVAWTVRQLQRRGADYADVRYDHLLHENLVAEQEHVASISRFESAGLGLRVLIKGSWGFAATPHLTRPAVTRAIQQAIGLAKACTILNRGARPLAPVRPVRAHHRSRCAVDPFEVPLARKIDYLLWANQTVLGPDAIQRVASHMDFYKRRKLFVSTEGPHPERPFTEGGAGRGGAPRRGDVVQQRSVPNSHHGAL